MNTAAAISFELSNQLSETKRAAVTEADHQSIASDLERQVIDLRAACSRLKLALDEIANFPRDVDEGVLKNIARRALAD